MLLCGDVIRLAGGIYLALLREQLAAFGVLGTEDPSRLSSAEVDGLQVPSLSLLVLLLRRVKPPREELLGEDADERGEHRS